MAMQLDRFQGLSCELKKMNNDPVSMGQVIDVNEDILQIQAPRSEEHTSELQSLA